MSAPELLEPFRDCLDLASVLESVRRTYEGYELVDHWQQGEFHHDVVLRPARSPRMPELPVLIVATNCNGGVKELLAFDELPERYALWHSRCPENPEFEGELPTLRATLRTHHWFDPCELLAEDARSELRPEFRERMRGGGFTCRAKPGDRPS